MGRHTAIGMPESQAGYSILHTLSLKSLANLSWVSKEFRNASHCPGGRRQRPLHRRRFPVAVGRFDAGADDGWVCPQRDILEPMGAGNRRNPPGLPPRPARLRPLGSTSERILLHSRDDRDAGPGGARRLVLVEGALSWRILWRDLALRPPTALPPEPALRSTTGIHPIEPVPVGVANGRCRA